jgi:nucleoside-diphosphate-sugar epimerase
MRVLVTGATGFIGSRVVERLVATRADVRVLVPPAEVAQSPAVAALRAVPGIEVVVGGIEDGQALVAAAAGVEVVHHLAFVFRHSGAPGRGLLEANVSGTDNIMQACVRQGVRRVVLASSATVYGLPEQATTEAAPLRPRGPYAWSKVAAERIVVGYATRFGLDAVILRPTITYGPGGRFGEQLCGHMLITPPDVLPDRDVLVQWLHVEDLADAVVAAGNRPVGGGTVFNLAGSQMATIREIAALARWGAGLSPQPPARDRGTGRPFRYDTGKARAMLGFRPNITYERGIPELGRTMRPRLAG